MIEQMKYEFASPQWMAALHGLILATHAQEVKAKPKLWMSVCVVYYNPPTHLSLTGKLAWSCVIQGKDVDFRTVERDDVRFKLLTEYESTVPLARYVVGEVAERKREMASMIAERSAAGKLSMPFGPQKQGENQMSSVHDLFALLTT